MTEHFVITDEPVFTFWEGKKPAYIELCMETWRAGYVELNYSNLREFTDLSIDKMKRFSLPQQADCVRAHVLRDQGGYWLDADTIMMYAALPETDMIGHPQTRANTIGYLHAEKNSPMYILWSQYQDRIMETEKTPAHWSIMGNAFTDGYVKEHLEVSIASVRKSWPETYRVFGRTRQEQYTKFWFEEKHHLKDLDLTELLMLHNSWTPEWYKQLTREEVLNHDCTLSNILREMLI